VFGNDRHHLFGLVPVEPSGMPGLLRCQYDKDDLEYAGLPKLDLLGLRMHTALSEAGELASRRLGVRVDPYKLPAGDRETYALIRTGKNAGMFQLESPGQMALSRRLLVASVIWSPRSRFSGPARFVGISSRLTS
jgi:error-prone DNA polymerase